MSLLDSKPPTSRIGAGGLQSYEEDAARSMLNQVMSSMLPANGGSHGTFGGFKQPSRRKRVNPPSYDFSPEVPRSSGTHGHSTAATPDFKAEHHIQHPREAQQQRRGGFGTQGWANGDLDLDMDDDVVQGSFQELPSEPVRQSSGATVGSSSNSNGFVPLSTDEFENELESIRQNNAHLISGLHQQRQHQQELQLKRTTSDPLSPRLTGSLHSQHMRFQQPELQRPPSQPGTKPLIRNLGVESSMESVSLAGAFRYDIGSASNRRRSESQPENKDSSQATPLRSNGNLGPPARVSSRSTRPARRNSTADNQTDDREEVRQSGARLRSSSESRHSRQGSGHSRQGSGHSREGSGSSPGRRTRHKRRSSRERNGLAGSLRKSLNSANSGSKSTVVGFGSGAPRLSRRPSGEASSTGSAASSRPVSRNGSAKSSRNGSRRGSPREDESSSARRKRATRTPPPPAPVSPRSMQRPRHLNGPSEDAQNRGMIVAEAGERRGSLASPTHSKIEHTDKAPASKGSDFAVPRHNARPQAAANRVALRIVQRRPLDLQRSSSQSPLDPDFDADLHSQPRTPRRIEPLTPSQPGQPSSHSHSHPHSHPHSSGRVPTHDSDLSDALSGSQRSVANKPMLLDSWLPFTVEAPQQVVHSPLPPPAAPHSESLRPQGRGFGSNKSSPSRPQNINTSVRAVDSSHLGTPLVLTDMVSPMSGRDLPPVRAPGGSYSGRGSMRSPTSLKSPTSAPAVYKRMAHRNASRHYVTSPQSADVYHRTSSSPPASSASPALGPVSQGGTGWGKVKEYSSMVSEEKPQKKLISRITEDPEHEDEESRASPVAMLDARAASVAGSDVRAPQAMRMSHGEELPTMTQWQWVRESQLSPSFQDADVKSAEHSRSSSRGDPTYWRPSVSPKSAVGPTAVGRTSPQQPLRSQQLQQVPRPQQQHQRSTSASSMPPPPMQSPEPALRPSEVHAGETECLECGRHVRQESMDVHDKICRLSQSARMNRGTWSRRSSRGQSIAEVAMAQNGGQNRGQTTGGQTSGSAVGAIDNEAGFLAALKASMPHVKGGSEVKTVAEFAALQQQQQLRDQARRERHDEPERLRNQPARQERVVEAERVLDPQAQQEHLDEAEPLRDEHSRRKPHDEADKLDSHGAERLPSRQVVRGRLARVEQDPVAVVSSPSPPQQASPPTAVASDSHVPAAVLDTSHPAGGPPLPFSAPHAAEPAAVAVSGPVDIDADESKPTDDSNGETRTSTSKLRLAVPAAQPLTQGVSPVSGGGDLTTPVGSGLVPCPDCGRTFRPESLMVHVRSCKKVFVRKKPASATTCEHCNRTFGTEDQKAIHQRVCLRNNQTASLTSQAASMGTIASAGDPLRRSQSFPFGGMSPTKKSSILEASAPNASHSPTRAPPMRRRQTSPTKSPGKARRHFSAGVRSQTEMTAIANEQSEAEKTLDRRPGSTAPTGHAASEASAAAPAAPHVPETGITCPYCVKPRAPGPGQLCGPCATRLQLKRQKREEKCGVCKAVRRGNLDFCPQCGSNYQHRGGVSQSPSNGNRSPMRPRGLRSSSEFALNTLAARSPQRTRPATRERSAAPRMQRAATTIRTPTNAASTYPASSSASEDRPSTRSGRAQAASAGVRNVTREQDMSQGIQGDGGLASAYEADKALQPRQAARRFIMSGVDVPSRSRAVSRHGDPSSAHGELAEPATARTHNSSAATNARRPTRSAGSLLGTLGGRANLSATARTTQCPHCLRSFSLQASERHIPVCENVRSKPRAIRRGNSKLAYMRV